MRILSTFGLGLSCAWALAIWTPGVSLAGEASKSTARPESAEAVEIDALFADLDAADCDTRDAAAERLATLAEQPAWQSHLAERAKSALRSLDTSYELRLRLKTLLALLPTNTTVASSDASTAKGVEKVVNSEEVDRLIAQLDDDSPALRASAAARLAAFAQQPDSNAQVLSRLTAIVDEPCDVPGLARERLRLWNIAHRAWLTSDPATWQLPAVTDEQIDAWVITLAAPGAPSTVEVAAAQAAARRQLVDLLARDEYVSRVKQALAKQLGDPQLNVDAADRLREVDDWTRPAMVAEYWQGPQHLGIQHLLIGIPNQSEGAERPSLFDRCDAATAHCVSGNSLSPGDYPVGVFFPHPRDGDAQFHLINLPTPRQRLVYDCDVERPVSLRLAEITERTLDWMIARGQPLSLAELAMLEELDAEAVSLFAGKYFLKVDDSLYEDGMQNQLVGQLSRHHNLCCLLARRGTATAVPGIVAAIEAGRFLPPRDEAPYHWPWMAALAIANRDPWPERDDWLAGLVSRTDVLVHRPTGADTSPEGDERNPDQPSDVATPLVPRNAREVRAPGALWLGAYSEASPDIGACAAGMLLVRYRMPPTAFGLDSTAYPPFTTFGFSGYWFRDPAGRDKVLSWWQEQRRAADLPAPSPGVALGR
ncbi:MAG: hypothetical protein AB7U73_04850 [Pirellulales bacterium]